MNGDARVAPQPLLRHQHTHVVEVERAGLDVEVADAEQIKRGADRAHDDVVEARQHGSAVAHSDQCVASQRGDFNQHVEIEGVVGHHDATKPRQQKQVERVEKRRLLADLIGDAGLGEHGVEQTDQHDGQHHQRRQSIEPVFDAEGRLPTAEPVTQFATGGEHVAQSHDGTNARDAKRHQRHRPRHHRVLTPKKGDDQGPEYGGEDGNDRRLMG